MAVLIGLFIGLVLGLTGAGGSLFAVPLLMIALDYDANTAMGMSLGIVALSALMGSFLHLRSKSIQWSPAIAFLVLGSIFAPLGNYLRTIIPDDFLLLGFSLLVMFVAAKLWINANKQPNNSKVVRSRPYQGTNQQAICPIKHERFKVGLPCVAAMGGAAAITGILSGLFGVGGGFLIVPALIMITGIAIHQAVATSLVIISAISSVGFISFILSAETSLFNQTLLIDFIQICFAGLIAMLLAKLISNKITGPTLQKSFAALLIIIMVILYFL